MRKKWLLLSFAEGAAVMGAELCGARLLAPVFGSSLYVWASVMGFTLLALAAGYFFGGSISERKSDAQAALRQLLCWSGISLCAMPVLAHYLVPRISYLPFSPGMIISTALVLIPAVFLLGCTSPLFIQVQTSNPSKTGRVSGTVYAVSTAGGIIATFICGFFLIPVLGLINTLLIFGSILFILTLIIFRSYPWLEVFFFVLVLYLNYQIIHGGKQMIERSDSVLGTMKVFDVAQNGDSIRYLSINDIIQSELSLKTRKTPAAYIQLLDSLIKPAQGNEKAVVLGLGAGVTANMLVEKKYRTAGVEFDERISRAATDYFALDKNVEVLNVDARYFLNHYSGQLHLVLADLFKAEEQPSHVFTKESLIDLRQHLAPGACLYITWHGYTEGERGRRTRILLNTLREAGYTTRVCSMSENEAHRNLIIVASVKQLPHLKHEIKPLSPDLLVNTDDCPRLEKFNAEANKSWRTSYLRYYQGLSQ